MIDTLLLLVGLGLILKGGDWFVGAAARLAEFLGMPRVVIGSTLVSLATTTPELTVSIVAGVQGDSSVAVGNAVGSCICNIGLILGVTALIRHVEVHPSALRIPLAAMFVAGIALFLLTLDLRLGRVQGAALVLVGVGYFAWDFLRHYRDRDPAALLEARVIEKEVSPEGVYLLSTKPGTLLQFVVSAGIIVLGSRLLVGGAIGLANRLGIPPIVVGLTVVAVGTSLPELITAITCSRRAVSDLSVGNVLGANIANLTFVIGTAAVIHEVRMDRLTQLLNFPVMLLMMMLLVWSLFTDRRVTRKEGAVMVVCYGLYISILVVLTLFQRPR